MVPGKLNIKLWTSLHSSGGWLPEFGQELQQALKEAGTKIKVTTPYYTEANGMIERGHQPLKDTSVKLFEGNGKRWRHYLTLGLFADRISTKMSTVLLNF